MNRVRKIFLIVLALALIATISGVVTMTVMEYQARAALPGAEQNAQTIAQLYDGAVCLGCDLMRVAIGMFGGAFVVLTVFCWGIYEIVRAFLNRNVALK